MCALRAHISKIHYKYGIIKTMSIMIIMSENDILLIIIGSHNKL